MEHFCFWQVELLRKRKGQIKERIICLKKSLLEYCPYQESDLIFLENEETGRLYLTNRNCPYFISSSRNCNYKRIYT